MKAVQNAPLLRGFFNPISECDAERLFIFQLFPGNVRELRTVIERTVILARLPARPLYSIAENS
jgi:transcriptional regulator with GAF, ATPase, and Fis domain